MILKTIGFLSGVHLTMTFFGACYRIIDLAHELGQHLVSIVKNRPQFDDHFAHIRLC